MKVIAKMLTIALAMLLMHTSTLQAQKIDEERMRRDIEVAENVLSTLIKHEISSQRTIFPLDVKGSYQEGYGVTFRLPGDHALPMIISSPDNFVYNFSLSDEVAPTVSFGRRVEEDAVVPAEEDEKKDRNAITLKESAREKKRMRADSILDDYNNKLIKAAKNFIIDYGDFMTQLGPDEKIIVTNRGDNNRVRYFGDGKRTHLSVEGTKADVLAFKQGKLTRDQLLAKLKVMNTESVEVKEADLELLSSIFSRLYRVDLSKTYFTEGNVNYERLKDYGVIYYMQVYSSRNADAFGQSRFHNLPTIGMDGVDQATRDKKVTELYPQFERELKENILEYGRTLKTLGDDELLVFNVAVTKCEQCGIPSTLELSVKGAVLKDFDAGKIDKAAGLTKFTTKKGPKQ